MTPPRRVPADDPTEPPASARPAEGTPPPTSPQTPRQADAPQRKRLQLKPGAAPAHAERPSARPPVRPGGAPRQRAQAAFQATSKTISQAAPQPSHGPAGRPAKPAAPAAPQRSLPPASRTAPSTSPGARKPPAPAARADAPPRPPRDRLPVPGAAARADATAHAAVGPAPGPAPASPHAAEGARVAKLMTERGLCSRREADAWIEAGWVQVDGRPAVLGQRARADAVIAIDPRARAEQARRVTVLVHKPVGLVSGQAEDGYAPAISLVTPAHRWAGDNSGLAFHPGHLRHLAPAGRLDIDSTGLLVLTQDGRIAKRLIGDQTRVEKEYLVRVRPVQPGPVPEASLERLRHGLVLDGVALREARVSWQNEDQLRIVLREGRKRQIRRMCELVGLEVLGLKRVRIGSVVLGQLPQGQWRYLRDDERF